METLNFNDEIKVTYCVPLWLRNEQIKVSINRVKTRIAPVYEKRAEPIAIACYGPSLNNTWEQIKNFKYIISCSGSHKFLLERNIIPTWHVEVDPREHKTQLIGTPHKDVEYLISSTCHPKVFDLLEGYNVKLWHVLDSKEEAFRILPPGEWALTGGGSVGLRAMTIARFLGFTDLHIFGMDGNEGVSGKHAAFHPNQPNDHYLMEYDGVTYKTTPSLLICAKQTWHELNQMPGVKATFYGEGLVQHMARNYVPNCIDIDQAVIGYNKPELISREYKELNIKLHYDNLAYGVGGGKHTTIIMKLINHMNTKAILDYGCGKGYLGKSLPFPIWEYDPAIVGKDEAPRPADLVICTDVLEHIELEKILFVLDDLQRCIQQFGYFVIHTGASSKILSDGRNAHLIQKDRYWWFKKLEQFFTVGNLILRGLEIYVVVGHKSKTIKDIEVLENLLLDEFEKNA